MAKKIKTIDYEIKITPSTKDTTYVLDKKIANDNNTYIQVHTEDASPLSVYLDFAVKKGSNDLVLVGMSYDSDRYTYVKASTQTIKKYLAYAKNNNNLISYCNYNDVQNVINKGIYLATGTVKEKLHSLYGAKGNNTYKAITEFKDGSDSPSNFYELGGKDKYDLQTDISVYDMSGNDKYTLQSEQIYVYDLAGKDSYTFNGGNTYVKDYKGNDKFTVNKDAHVTITDFEGKDKYTVKDTEYSNDAYLSIDDYSGKDTYNFNHATDIRITDGVYTQTPYSELEQYIGKSGNDSYSFVYSTDFEIEDYCGNDSYKITKCSNYDASLPIFDYEGNDKYTITDSDTIEIEDDKGNDKYTVSGKESYDVNITDEYGADTYKITKGARDITVTDNHGDDTYKLNGAKKNRIQNVYLTDKAGDDKYNISNSYGVLIKDDAHDDTYTIDRTANFTIIQDCGGDDKLVLSGAKASDIVFMSYNNKSDDENAKAEAGALFLYNKKLDTFVRIDNVYTVSGDTYSGVGNGDIETMKAGKSKLTAPSADFFTTSINSEVAGWLEDYGYESVTEALVMGKGADLIQFFQG